MNTKAHLNLILMMLSMEW